MSLVILIDGKRAALPENISFDFIAENRLFSDADDYTLAITLPLKDCPVNKQIFGNINRHGHGLQAAPFDMEIHAGKNTFRGSGIVTAVTQSDIKVQFLRGRSAQNYYSDLDEIYINNLDLGEVPKEYFNRDNVSVQTAWAGHSGGSDIVAIPWVNSGTGNIQNDTRLGTPEELGTGTPSAWVPGCDQVWNAPKGSDDIQESEDYQLGLSWMPYLYDIAVAICNAIGYQFDFHVWRNSKFYHLLVCNAVPYTWDHLWATLMPHWSVIEFFRNLEPLIEGYFDIDSVTKKIEFVPMSVTRYIHHTIPLDRIIDEFSSDVFDDSEECKMISERYLGYATQDSKTARAYSCPWLIRELDRNGNVRKFDDAADLSGTAKSERWRNYRSQAHRPSNREKPTYINFINEENRYVSRRVILGKAVALPGSVFQSEVDAIVNVPILVNNLGPRNVPDLDKDIDSVDLELKFVPPVIDYTDFRRMPFINLGDYANKTAEPVYDPDETKVGDEYYDSVVMQKIEQGHDDNSAAYFSNITVAFYPGAGECSRGGSEIYPIVDNVDFDTLWEVWKPENREFTLSLQDSDGKFADIPKIDRKVRYEYTFLSDTLPDVRMNFMIRGKLYVCEKLTATFNAEGMSHKIKGTFWLINSVAP